MKKSHYFKTKMIRLGRWTLAPADAESWNGVDASLTFFKKVYGFKKSLLILCKLNEGGLYFYISEKLLKKIYQYIKVINERDPKALAKKLSKFYIEKKNLVKLVPEINPKKFSTITNQDLIKKYQKNRDFAHRISVYDQFGWLAEDYWNPIMEKLLITKYKIKKDSPEYFKVLFILVKPEQISTTLEEKRAVLRSAILIHNEISTIHQEAQKLTKNYGWLPVFVTASMPWDAQHYEQELIELIKTNKNELQSEYKALKNFSTIRNKEFQTVCKQYKITPKDQQIFIDFGLALDARNEAEYMQSLCGYYLRPIYSEIAKRLYLSVKQVRNLYETEIIACLKGKSDALELLHQKGKFAGFGFNKSETERINFSKEEVEELFEHLEKNTKDLHGHDENKGLCASPGTAKGKIKIVTSPDLNSIVETGDIMVTEATTVDYLPAMKKAGAIITEVGSLTCHAAVVSREFGIPCIVSLKNATKNFKDGDLVEVDANNGIIKRV